MSDLLRWFLAVEILGLAVLPLVWRLFSTFPTRGTAYARTFGLLAVGLVAWLLPTLHVAPYGRALLLVSVVLVALGCWIGCGRWLVGEFRHLRRAEYLSLVLPEVVFWVAVAAHGYIISLNPSIWLSEKPMNFAIVNAINRSDWFPPYDPWLAGYPLNYYYFGHVLIALLIRLSQVPTTIGFSLAGATSTGLMASAISALVLDVTLRQGSDHKAAPSLRHLFPVAATVALAAVWMALGTGNLVPAQQAIREPAILQRWLTQGEADWWRVPYHAHGQGGLSELPWRTFMMAYLHSFAVASIFLVLLCAWVLRGWTTGTASDSTSPRQPRLWWATLPLVWAGTALISPWLLPATLLLLGFLFLSQAVALAHHRPERATFLRQVAGLGAGWGFTLLVLFLLLTAFERSYQAPPLRPNWTPETAIAIPFGTFALQSGVKWFIVAIVLGARLRGFPWRRWWPLVVLPLAVLLLLLASGWLGGGVLITLSLGWLTLVAGLRLYVERREVPFSLVLLFVALVMDALPYFVTIHDSNETLFKFGFVAWLLTSTGVFMEVGTLWASGAFPQRVVRYGLLGTLSLMLFLGTWMPLLATATLTNQFQGPETGRTLDGATVYFQKRDPDELAAIEWLKENAVGNPIILEATDAVYTHGGRVSALTGLPTLIEWYSHEYLWHEGQPAVHEEIGRRIQDVSLIYATTDTHMAQCLLEAYGVEYLFVGLVEREQAESRAASGDTAAWDALHKFGEFMDVVYPPAGTAEQGDVTIYRRRTASDAQPPCP
jgi:YYY domain-containing protein